MTLSRRGSSDVVVEQVLEDLRVVRRVAFDLLEQKPWVRHSLTWQVGEALPDDQRNRVTLGQLGKMLEVLVPPTVTEDAVGRVMEALGRNPDLKAGVKKALLGGGFAETGGEKLLHELWAWCKDQPGYESERDRIKGLLGGIQRALIGWRRS